MFRWFLSPGYAKMLPEPTCSKCVRVFLLLIISIHSCTIHQLAPCFFNLYCDDADQAIVISDYFTTNLSTGA